MSEPHNSDPGGADYQGLLQRIEAIPADTSGLLLAELLTPLLTELAQHPPQIREAILKDSIGKRFSLSAEELKTYRKETNRKSKKQDQQLAISDGPTDILEQLDRDKGITYINPAQDFHNGEMFFAVSIGNAPYIMRSNGDPVPFDRLKNGSLRLRHEDVDTFRFSPEGIAHYVRHQPTLRLPELFDQVRDYISRFVVIQDKRWYIVLSLWTLGTYLHSIFQEFSYLWINAERGSGKTTLLQVLAGVCFNADHQLGLTPASMFRDVSNNSTTMLLDEAEQMRSQDKEARADLLTLLNSGYQKGAVVKRTEKGRNGKFETKRFSTYSPKAFAGIGDLYEVLRDRTIRIPLLKAKSTELIEDYRPSPLILAQQREMRDELYMFALKWGPDLANIYLSPKCTVRGLDHLIGREKSLWLPLFLIAEAVDESNGSTELIDALRELSKLSVEEKQKAACDSSGLMTLLSVLKRMIEDLSPVEQTEGRLVFEATAVFEYFKGTEEFGWLEHRHTLTRRLGQYGFRKDRRREEGQRRDFYVILTETLDGLCERYGVPT